jgi:hypothetical protein
MVQQANGYFLGDGVHDSGFRDFLEVRPFETMIDSEVASPDWH